MSNPTNNYIGSFHFRVYVEGITAPINSFFKVSSLTSSEEGVDMMHGNDRSVRKMSGRQDWQDLEMERYYEGMDELYAWRQRIVDGHFDARTVRVDYLRADGSVARSMALIECWPIKWVLPECDAMGSHIAVEKVSLACESVLMLA